MDNNYSLKIMESYIEIDKLNDEINRKIFDFITKSNELVEMSEDDYQLEKTLKLNKISLKGYVLDSDCCIFLKENNIKDYTIEELKEYFSDYEKKSKEDCSKYYLAISLFEEVELIEKLVDKKIDLEIEKIGELDNTINNIKNISQKEIENLYIDIKKNLNNNYLNQNLIDDKSYNTCIQIVNDIFNYYVNGYPDIPNEYLYNENEGM